MALEMVRVFSKNLGMNRRCALATLLSIGAACSRKDNAQSRPLRVAAASDLEPVFALLAEPYRQKKQHAVVFSFAASGVLASQIEHGAPFDLFVSASQTHIDALRKKKRLVPSSIRVYAQGQLALWAQLAHPIPSLEDLASDARLRIALANPEHAPYGAAAVAALRSLGIYERVKPRLVFAENVRQAQLFTESGNTHVSIIARSLAGGSGHFLEIPRTLHPPILQSLGIVAGQDETRAQAFVDLLESQEGQQHLREAGFLSPRD